MNEISYETIKQNVKDHAYDVIWNKPSWKVDTHRYFFRIDNEDARQNMEAWAKKRNENWTYHGGNSFTYIVKTETPIALILQKKFNDKDWLFHKELDNPCLSINTRTISDHIQDAFTYIDIDTDAGPGFKLEGQAGTGPVRGFINTPNEEKKMQKIEQYYVIGGEKFSVPNHNLELAEATLTRLATQLVAIKAERKERKKVFEDGLPLVLGDKYDREISNLLESISLLDEITELDDGY